MGLGLEAVFLAIRSVPGWLLLAPFGQEESIVAMDDAWLSMVRGERPGGVDFGLVEEVTKADRSWALERRREFLTGEEGRLRGRIAAQRLLAGRLVLRAMTTKGQKFIEAFFSSADDEAALIRVTKELSSLDRPESVDRVSDEQIRKAKEFPLWRLLGKKPKDKIKCVMHDDKNASLYLYEDGGYCFVCCKQVDSIGYLMKTRSMTFLEAVQAI